MIFHLANQNIFLILFLILAGIILLTCLKIFKLLKRKKGGFSPLEGFAKNELFLRISEEFYDQLKKIIEEEIKDNLLEFKNEIKKTSEEIIKNYQFQFEKETGKIKEIFSEVNKQVSLGAEEVRKQVEIFKNKTQNELFQLSKFNLEAQRKISEDAIEIFSIELSRRIAQVYQFGEKTLKEKIEKTEREIEDYKKEKLKEVDRKIYLMLGEIAKKTLGKAIDLSDHEKLIMEALEKAKKEIF